MSKVKPILYMLGKGGISVLQTAIFMDEVLKVPYKCCCFSARSVQGRIQIGTKIGHGVPFFEELLQTGKHQQQTECIAVV